MPKILLEYDYIFCTGKFSGLSMCFFALATGADLGGGGGGGGEGGLTPPSGIRLCTTLRYPFLMMDPKNFIKEPSAPIYTSFEGGARAEKTRFFGQIFPKKA